LPCGAAAAIFVVLFLRIPPNIKPAGVSLKEKFLQMDFPGVVFITSALLCYLLALQWGGITKRWGSSDVIGTLVGFAVLILAFLLCEYYQGERAFLLRKVTNNRMVAMGAIYCFLYVK
jgi:hypothetical protein